jgi:hypothetical protein
MDTRYFRSPNGELVSTTDADVADQLAVLGHRPIDPRTAATATRAGNAAIPWPGSREDLVGVHAIRAAAELAPGVLYVQLGHVPQARSVEAASDRELVGAIVRARELRAVG